MAPHAEREPGHAHAEFFIGSSREALEKGISQAFHDELRKRRVAATLWSEKSVFTPSEFTLNSLERALDRFPNALIILSPDDVTHIRRKKERSARDNAIFEYGLFVGRHGRESVFIAVPDSVAMRIPTDFVGMTPVTYKITAGADGKESYDVEIACDQIVATLASNRSPTLRRPSPFWDVLGDRIFILYGIDAELGIQQHMRYRVSLRDLETAAALQSFLDRRYPRKSVMQIPATTSGWEQVASTDADLVVVGGFVTNAVFAKHRSRYEQSFRLKMGRLCIVEGQQVHHPEFIAPPGCSAPDASDPQKVEDYPTELTSRDFGFVFNGVLPIHGRERRVVAIAGVKGHGTRGAARYVTDHPAGVDTQLRQSLEHGDALELVVAVHVDSNRVDHIEPVSIVVNTQTLFPTVTKYAKPCELNRLCEGCDFGVPRTDPRLMAVPRLLRSQIRRIVFDLDDTLVDTFGLLITPYEIRAAMAMIAAEADAKNREPMTVAATLLRIRRSAPGDIDNELRRLGHFSSKAVAARKKVFSNVALDNLVLSPEVAQLLNRLGGQFDLCLLTSGQARFQMAKIRHLQLHRHFPEVEVVRDSTWRAKATAIQTIAEKHRLRPENVLVVGNRLDAEIAAGNTLGMPTVWIRHGEGSDQQPSRETGQPSFVVRSILEIESLLA